MTDTMPAYYRSAEWNRLRALVLERDGHVCFYCGERASTADHVLARGCGGFDDPENLVACCLICNTVAGGKWFRDKAAKREWVVSQLKRKTRKVRGKPGFDRQHYEATMRHLRRLERAG